MTQGLRYGVPTSATPPVPGRYTCDQSTLQCPNGHALIWHKLGFRVVLRITNGWVIAECKECRPEPTYFAGSFQHMPEPIVVCYPLSRESWTEWQNGEEIPGDAEMRSRLKSPEGRSYNPSYRLAKR